MGRAWGLPATRSFNPSEKYESQLGLLFPTEWKNKIHVPNHQPDIFTHIYIYILYSLYIYIYIYTIIYITSSS